MHLKTMLLFETSTTKSTRFLNTNTKFLLEIKLFIVLLYKNQVVATQNIDPCVGEIKTSLLVM